MFAESVYLASREDLGATEEFERFQQVVMGWLPMGDRWTLGLRGDYQWASEGTPFFLRPYIKLRGVEAMRYQGDDMASVEVEARWQARGRWSLVGAAGYGSARTERALYSATRDIVSGAVGFRYELARKVRAARRNGRRDSVRIRPRSTSRLETPGSGPDDKFRPSFSCRIPRPENESRGILHETSGHLTAVAALAVLAAVATISLPRATRRIPRASKRPSPATGANPKPRRAM